MSKNNTNKTKTYNVLPGTQMGMLSTEYLEKMTAIARKYNIPFFKITSAQRLAIVGHEPETAEQMSKIFTEVVVAPSFSQGAIDVLTKKKNIRLVIWPTDQPARAGLEVKAVEGGFLLQDLDIVIPNYDNWKVVTKRQPTDAEWDAMKFGWKVGKWVKSNAVVYVNDTKTLDEKDVNEMRNEGWPEDFIQQDPGI